MVYTTSLCSHQGILPVSAEIDFWICLATQTPLCLPLKQGGLGLINPIKQHLVLQKNFLDLVFWDETIKALIMWFPHSY